MNGYEMAFVVAVLTSVVAGVTSVAEIAGATSAAGKVAYDAAWAISDTAGKISVVAGVTFVDEGASVDSKLNLASRSSLPPHLVLVSLSPFFPAREAAASSRPCPKRERGRPFYPHPPLPDLRPPPTITLHRTPSLGRPTEPGARCRLISISSRATTAHCDWKTIRGTNWTILPRSLTK